MDKKEIRAYSCTMEKREETRGQLVGRPIIYGVPADLGPFTEIIEQGALDTADLRDVALLLNHNMDGVPLARSRNNNENSTMQLIPDAEGLLIRANLDIDNNPDAAAVYSAVERGDLDKMSFCFTVNGEEWEGLESDHPVRHIRSIKRVFEVSAVTFPAYAETSIVARNLPGTLDSATATLDSAKRAADAIRRKKTKIRLLTEV